MINIRFKDVEFDLQKPIAQGSMGTVHKGVWSGINVAIKVIRATYEPDSNFQTQLLKDVQLLTHLRHDNLISVYGVSVDENIPLIVLEYADGGSLYSYLRRSPEKITGPEVINHLLHQISLGMLFLHSQTPPILHGNLKTANCLLSTGLLGTVIKITDFGFYRAQSETISVRGNVGLSGSLCWMAPERLNGEKLTKMVDVYAFAMTAYEILSIGNLPFELDGIRDVNIIGALMNQIRLIRPPVLTYDEKHWELVQRCWNQDASLRPSFFEVVGVVEGIGRDLGGEERRSRRMTPLIMSESSRVVSLGGFSVGSFSDDTSTEYGSSENLYIRRNTEIQRESAMMNNPHQPGVGILNNYAGQAPVNNNYSGQIPVNNNYSGQIPVKNNYSGPQIPVNNLSGPIPVVNSSSIPVVNVDMNAKLRPTSKYSSGLGYIEIVQDPPQQQPQRAIEMIPMQRNYVETPSVSDISSVSRNNYKRRTPPPIKKVPFWKTRCCVIFMIVLGILTIGVGVTLAVLFSKQAQQSSSKTPGTIARKYVGHTGRVWSLAILPSTPPRLFSASFDNTTREWDLPTGNVVRTLSGHTDGIYSIAVLDGTPLRLFSGSADKTVREWDLSTGQLSRTYYGSLLDVQAVAVIPGTPPRLFSGSWDNTTREWDMNTGQVIRNFTGHTDSVISLGVLAGSTPRLFSGSSSKDSTIKEWDLTTSANIRTFTGHTAYVEYIAILPGSTINGGKPRMFSCSSDKTIREWDMSTGETVRTFYGHTSFVLSLAVLDGNPPRLFSGSADNSIREWDVNTAQTVRVYSGHTDAVRSVVVVNGNPPRMFSGGYDNTIIEWAI